jgi:hypothetical protein
MVLSRWLKRLGHRDRHCRVSAVKRSVRPNLEALEGREVPTVSPVWPPISPPITQLLAPMSGTPFGASSDGEKPMTHQQAVTASAGSSAPVVFVHAGQSIQAAINSATAGSTIYIDPGVYSETLHVHTANLTLVGLLGTDGSHATLVNPGQGGDGVQVDTSATGFAMRFLEVRGFQNGVEVDGTQNFRLTHLMLDNNTGSGVITTAHSANGVVQYTQEFGNRAAGIEVQNADGILVQYNRTYSNVVGVEVINSPGVMVQLNSVFDNTAGIIVAQLPGGWSSAGDMIADNYVSNNNHRNFAVAGTLESYAVQGTGIELLGARATVVADNLVIGNETMGIGVVSAAVLPARFTTSPTGSDATDLSASGNVIVANCAVGNGFHSMSTAWPHGADMVWDGLGHPDTWIGNSYWTSGPASLSP